MYSLERTGSLFIIYFVFHGKLSETLLLDICSQILVQVARLAKHHILYLIFKAAEQCCYLEWHSATHIVQCEDIWKGVRELTTHYMHFALSIRLCSHHYDFLSKTGLVLKFRNLILLTLPPLKRVRWDVAALTNGICITILPPTLVSKVILLFYRFIINEWRVHSEVRKHTKKVSDFYHWVFFPTEFEYKTTMPLPLF